MVELLRRSETANEQQQMWKLILEAFKIIHYKDSTVKCQDIYEQTLKLSYIDLHTRYSTTEKTNTFKHLIDYLLYIYELKYKH